MAAFISGGVTLAATSGRLPASARRSRPAARSTSRAPAAIPGRRPSLPERRSPRSTGDHGLAVTARRAWAAAGRSDRASPPAPARSTPSKAASGPPARVQIGTGSGSCGPVATSAAGRAAAVWSPFPIRSPTCFARRAATGRRPLGHRHAPVHGRHDSRAGDAHLAVELEGAGLRERIRRSRGPRRHRRCEPVAPTGMRDTAAGGDRVRSSRGLARGGRPGGARGPRRHVGRAGRPLPGRGRRPAPTWPGSAAATSSSRPAPHSAGMRSLAPRRSRAPS